MNGEEGGNQSAFPESPRHLQQQEEEDSRVDGMEQGGDQMVNTEIGPEQFHQAAYGQVDQRHPDPGYQGAHPLDEALVGICVVDEFTGGEIKIIRIDRAMIADLPEHGESEKQEENNDACFDKKCFQSVAGYDLCFEKISGYGRLQLAKFVPVVKVSCARGFLYKR